MIRMLCLLLYFYWTRCILFFSGPNVFCNFYFVVLLGPCILHFVSSDSPSWKFERPAALLIWGKGWCWEGDADHMRQLLMFRCWRWCWSSPPPPHPGPPGDLVYLPPIYIFLPSHTRKAIYVLPLSHTTMCLIYCNFYLDETKAMISQGKFVSYSFSSQVYLHSTKPNSYNCIMHISWIHLPTFCVHQSNVVGFQIWHRIWFCQLFISIFSSM